MRKQADPGNLGAPFGGNFWPYNEDPPLYHRVHQDDKNKRGYTDMLDFWGAPSDNDSSIFNNQDLYPPANAWIKTRVPVPLGNIPSIEDIFNGDEDLNSSWSASPRSFQYHGNDFLIDGPYGQSDDALADGWFYNNMVPVPQRNRQVATERMLQDRKDQRNHWYNAYRRRFQDVPTLPHNNQSRTRTLYDFLGENVGPNSDGYGFNEPSTGGGGFGFAMNEVGYTKMHKLASEQNPENIDDISALVKRIKSHRGNMEYHQLSLLVEPLINASKKYQFKSLYLKTLATRLRSLSKRLQRTKDEKDKKELVDRIKQTVDEVSSRIQKAKKLKKEKKAQVNINGSNWYKMYILTND